MNDFIEHLPAKVDIVAVELTDNAKSLETYCHPERAVYILGGEDRTLPEEVLDKCTTIRKIDTRFCLNVASCATLVMYDRHLKELK
jgi:tRNA(Leu) C34 or U34 (ribose-2'-O)-methylase TrmL